jgi:Arc/MetJ-type ribon-helix-helix transcriptional regulator
MEVVNARFDEKLVSKLDRLVEKGLFKSRSEALRRATEDYLERNSQLFLEDAARKWLGAEMKDEELERICARILSGGSTAAEMVAEGRGR